MKMPGGPFADTELTCQELVELVTDYLDEALSEIDRVRFEQHLETCGYCHRHVDQVRRTIHVLGKVVHEPIAPERREELIALFRAWRSMDS